MLDTKQIFDDSLTSAYEELPPEILERIYDYVRSSTEAHFDRLRYRMRNKAHREMLLQLNDFIKAYDEVGNMLSSKFHQHLFNWGYFTGLHTTLGHHMVSSVDVCSHCGIEFMKPDPNAMMCEFCTLNTNQETLTNW